MEMLSYALKGIWHYRRINFVVLVAVAISTTVIGGSLIVGDSVRYSLRQMTEQRLGQITDVLTSPQFFREAIVQEMAADKSRDDNDEFSAAILVTGSVEFAPDDGSIRRAGSVGSFIWCPALRAELIGEFSPITTVKKVRDGSGKVVRDLGTKVVQGRRARGFVLALDNAAPDSGYDAVEVWVDPEADLPLEFSYERKHESGPIIYRVTNCRWNIELDSQVFSTTPPEGYTDTTPPAKKEDIIRIADALKLYAELSGGRYPRVSKSSGAALGDEMRKMAGFVGPRQVEWADDIKYQEIEEATIALDCLSRIVRNKFQIGYRGAEVSRDNKDQVLLWWTLQEGYLVFYGDLMTEVVTEEKWSQLVATDGLQQTHDGDQE